MKPYATLKLTEDEFTTVRSASMHTREHLWNKFAAAEDAGEEQDFYRERLRVYDALLRRLDAVLIADTSQDEEDEDEDEDEDE